MFSSLRFLLFSFLGSLFLTAAPLFGEEAPPLPPTATDKTLLRSLGAAFSGMGKKETKVIPREPVRLESVRPEPVHHEPARSVPSDYQEPRVLEKLPPPKPIRQASFTTKPLIQSPEEPVDTRTPIDIELPPESPEEQTLAEPVEISNETLAKPLVSRKSAKTGDVNTGDSAEAKEIPTLGGWKNKLAKPELTPLVSVGGSLLIVIAAFFLLAIILRKVSPKGNRPLPQEAFECLGRYYLTQKHQVQLLRIGSRIVLVSVMPDGVRTLSEITDPDEAIAVLGLCRRLDTNSATEMFRKTVASISEEELSRPHDRPVVTPRRRQSAASLDIYSDPDESLAAILSRGRHSGR